MQLCNCDLPRDKSKTIEPRSPNLVHMMTSRYCHMRLVLVKGQGHTAQNVRVPVHAYNVTALYWHSLDDTTVCCSSRALILIWRCLLLYLLNKHRHEWNTDTGVSNCISVWIWFDRKAESTSGLDQYVSSDMLFSKSGKPVLCPALAELQ